MGKPAVHPKPELTRLSSRVLQIPPVKHQLELKLLDWIVEVLHHTKHPHRIRGMPAANYLLSTAEGIDDIMSAPVSMALSSGLGQKTVEARFYFAGMPDGNWYVEHIKFAPKLSGLQMKMKADNDEAERLALKQRLVDRAGAERKLHPKYHAFPAEKYVDSWQSDVDKGAQIIAREVDVIYEHARKEAAIPDNPYAPKDVALGLMGGGVGQLGKTTERAEKLAKAYEKTDQALSAYGKLESVSEDQEAIRKYDEDHSVLKGGKSRGDVIVERAIDLAADLPGVGPFVKGFAGMFFNFASANFAGEVHKIRCRIYCWYIAGFVSGITGVINDTPVAEFDRRYNQFGLFRGRGMSFDAKMRAQLALLHYASEHYTSGDWGGTRLERPRNWTFPDDYLAHWSPDLLGKAMSALLCQKRFLID